jgi:hypothetical protein
MAKHTIKFEVDTEGATALLTFLRRLSPPDIGLLHRGVEWATFDKAATQLRVALRDVIEPGWREKA